MKRVLFGLVFFLSALIVLQSLVIFRPEIFSRFFPTVTPIHPKPLLVYTFKNLRQTTFPTTDIVLGPVLASHPDYVSQVFFYKVPVRPKSQILKKVSGLMNIPTKPGIYPVLLMFRGFVPESTYAPGVGTQPAASFFAQHGFITLAPDFLGYAQSDAPARDPFENRFQTYTTAATLLSSIATFPQAISASYGATIQPNMIKIGMWAHSNGGHIALSTLAITGVKYPTVLWAPVSASFPYDILYYTDESDDQGKALRATLAQFEEDYNTDLFSPPLYYSWIQAPMEIDQGTNDVEVPFWWTDGLVTTLKKNNPDINYNTYPGVDHNLLPNGWSQAVQNDLDFYLKEFSK